MVRPGQGRTWAVQDSKKIDVVFISFCEVKKVFVAVFPYWLRGSGKLAVGVCWITQPRGTLLMKAGLLLRTIAASR
jgi:hypothetical protein